LQAAKKFALAILFPYPVVSDLRDTDLYVTLLAHHDDKDTPMLWTIFVILLVGRHT
jgi:hypothetical protein